MDGRGKSGFCENDPTVSFLHRQRRWRVSGASISGRRAGDMEIEIVGDGAHRKGLRVGEERASRFWRGGSGVDELGREYFQGKHAFNDQN